MVNPRPKALTTATGAPITVAPDSTVVVDATPMVAIPAKLALNFIILLYLLRYFSRSLIVLSNFSFILYELEQMYHIGKAFYIHDVQKYKEETIKESATSFNHHVTIPRKSFCGLLLLFKQPFADGTYVSNKYFNPKITSAKVTIQGISISIYKQGIISVSRLRLFIKMSRLRLRTLVRISLIKMTINYLLDCIDKVTYDNKQRNGWIYV